MSLKIDVVPNRTSPPAILLRERWREGKRIGRRTLAMVPAVLVDGIRAMIKDGVVIEAVSIRRSLPHNHVRAVLGTQARTETSSRAWAPCSTGCASAGPWIEENLANRHLGDTTLIPF